MLQTCSYTGPLHSPDERRPHLTGQVRILAVVLEASSTQRRSFRVDSRAEHDGYILGDALLAKCLTHHVRHILVPAGCHKTCRRIACRRNRFLLSDPSICFLSPCGPSVIMTEERPAEGTPEICQASPPAIRAIFSSRLIRLTISSTSFISNLLFSKAKSFVQLSWRIVGIHILSYRVAHAPDDAFIVEFPLLTGVGFQIV